MECITVDELMLAVNGINVFSEKTVNIKSVAIDSRLCTPGCVFFALRGTVTDGHRYIRAAVENGAVAIVLEDECEIDGIAVIKVQDTFKALQDLAKWYISKFDIPFIAVTGSSGKTTTKDLIASVLAVKYNVHKTQGNLNSSTGVPLSIFGLTPGNQISVLEMSMSHPGEIYGNVDIVRPECAVITNIGMCHLEYLKTRDNIFKAKCEVFSFFEKDDVLIYNSDDDYLKTLSNRDFNTIGVGLESGDARAHIISEGKNGVDFSVSYKDEAHVFHFDYPGEHNVRNCLSAIAVAFKYGLSADDIQQGLNSFIPGKNRMQVEEVDGISFINDTYNSNPDALKASVDFLKNVAVGRKIAVLGDMLELGPQSKVIHEQTGLAIIDSLDMMITTGDMGKYFIPEDPRLLYKCHYFDDKAMLLKYLLNTLQEGGTVLFKASRGMQLDLILLDVFKELGK